MSHACTQVEALEKQISCNTAVIQCQSWSMNYTLV